MKRFEKKVDICIILCPLEFQPCLYFLASQSTSSSFVSGKNSAVIVHTNTPPPARYSTPVEPFRRAATRGATIDDSRPQNDASPHAEPRTTAGNASGVQPYNTALKVDWTGQPEPMYYPSNQRSGRVSLLKRAVKGK